MPAHSVSVISQDNYYFPKEKQQLDKNGKHNFDLPDSIDRISFVSDINLKRSMGIVMGNENKGISKGIRRRAEVKAK